MESDFVTISLVTTTSVRMGDSNPWAESGRDISDPTAYKVFSANCVFSKWGILSRWGTLFLFKPNYSIARMDYFYFCFGFLFICFVLLFNWVISSRNSFLELIKYNFRKGNVRCLQKKKTFLMALSSLLPEYFRSQDHQVWAFDYQRQGSLHVFWDPLATWNPHLLWLFQRRLLSVVCCDNISSSPTFIYCSWWPLFISSKAPEEKKSEDARLHPGNR